MRLFIDLETYSGVDIRKGGVYPYFESPDFEILLVGYAIDDGPIIAFEYDDYAAFGKFFAACVHADELIAHNATFERLAFRAKGVSLPAWTCTMVKAAFCGLPASLDQASKALDLPVKKDAAGKALIKYFCTPCKPTQANGGRTRNRPEDDPEKWQAFIDYLKDDVGTTRELYKALEPYEFTEKENYQLDQKINDRGVRIEKRLAVNALALNDSVVEALTVAVRRTTGIENPNSPAQLISWLNHNADEVYENLTAATVEERLPSASGPIRQVLEFRKLTSNTSIKKYQRALDYLCSDGRARGLIQFYGAGRTGRWAGRGIQLQNMPRNYMALLDMARDLVLAGDFEALEMLYDDPQQVLKELTRTMLAPEPGRVFLISDFAAIEARVIAWLAGEKWRLEVFETHGKIYEASAAAMFGVPIDEITKGSDYRAKGKIAELALGYQGGANALATMGGEAMGLSADDMRSIVKRWRRANPAITKYWSDVEAAAIKALKNPRRKIKLGYVTFVYDLKALLCFLPSGRPLIYQGPKLVAGRFGEAIRYQGADQKTGRWAMLDTYGGKLVENIVQAVARDLLAYSLQSVDAEGFDIVQHVHDEIVAEAEEAGADMALDLLIEAMVKKPSWAEGLPLAADGFVSPFYKKD